MRHRRALLATAVLATVLSSGCASSGAANTAGDAATASAPTAGTGTSSAPAAAGTAPAGASSTAGAADGIPDGYDAGRDAAADIKAALALSATDHRTVLLDFGANWCPDCKVLDKLFRSDQVAPVLHSDYRVVAVDVGKFDHNLELTARYVDLSTSGIPALVVLNPDGTVRTASNDGAFSNARAMTASTVAAYLKRWSQK